MVTSRPALLPTWRIEPNLTGQVSLGDGGMQVAGIKLNVSNEVKPLLDKTVNEQIGNLSNKLRNDRTLETAARKQWAQMCRSISLGQAAGRRAEPVARGASRPAPSRRSRKSSPTG